MNPITAPAGGVVKKILISDGQPVEFDQPLSSSAKADADENPEAADRQPRRDRAAHPSRLPRNGHQDGRGPLDRRRRRDARPPRRRDGVHRPAAGDRILPQHPEHHLGRRDRPRRRHPSRLRLPVSENAQFAEIVEAHDIIWVGPKPEHIRTMGDKIEAKRTAGQARPAAGPRLRRRRSPASRRRRSWPRRSAIRC